MNFCGGRDTNQSLTLFYHFIMPYLISPLVKAFRLILIIHELKLGFRASVGKTAAYHLFL